MGVRCIRRIGQRFAITHNRAAQRTTDWSLQNGWSLQVAGTWWKRKENVADGTQASNGQQAECSFKTGYLSRDTQSQISWSAFENNKESWMG